MPPTLGYLKMLPNMIDGVLQNTIEMYGSLLGISGSGAFWHIEALEFPEDIDSD